MSKLDYKIPRLVDEFLEGWLKTSNTGTVTSTLLAGVAAGIFIHIQEQLKFTSPNNSPPLPEGSPKADALLVVAYLAVLLNCSSTVAAFLLSDKIIGTPFHAAKKELTNESNYHEGLNELVDFYVDWPWWTPLRYYWIFCLFLGILSIFLEMLLYLWFLEPRIVVKVLVTACTALGLLPLVVFAIDILYLRLRAANNKSEKV